MTFGLDGLDLLLELLDRGMEFLGLDLALQVGQRIGHIAEHLFQGCFAVHGGITFRGGFDSDFGRRITGNALAFSRCSLPNRSCRCRPHLCDGLRRRHAGGGCPAPG